MCLGQPNFQAACEHGLQWCVLAAGTAIAWPQLPDLVQKALNTHSRQDQSEVEVMLDMKSMRDEAIRSKREVDWKQVMSSACSQSPPSKAYIEHIATYLQKQAPEFGGRIVDVCKKLASLGGRSKLPFGHIVEVSFCRN